MARGINKVILVGNVGQNPKIIQRGDLVVADLSLATSEGWKDKNSGENKQLTEWHRVVFFGNLAEIVDKYVKKGSKIYVEGKLKTEKYAADDGTDRYTTKIIAKELQMLDSKGAADKQDEDEPAAAAAAQPADDFSEDDIPF